MKLNCQGMAWLALLILLALVACDGALPVPSASPTPTRIEPLLPPRRVELEYTIRPAAQESVTELVRRFGSGAPSSAEVTAFLAGHPEILTANCQSPLDRCVREGAILKLSWQALQPLLLLSGTPQPNPSGGWMLQADGQSIALPGNAPELASLGGTRARLTAQMNWQTNQIVAILQIEQWNDRAPTGWVLKASARDGSLDAMPVWLALRVDPDMPPGYYPITIQFSPRSPWHLVHGQWQAETGAVANCPVGESCGKRRVFRPDPPDAIFEYDEYKDAYARRW